MTKPYFLAAALAAAMAMPAVGAAQAPPVAGVDVAAFIKRDIFRDIKITPNGDYLAATVPMEDRTGMVISRHIGGAKATAAKVAP